MRIVFMGTPDFAVPCLEALHDAGHPVVGVFTQPDKPKGRKMTLSPPPVKACAQELSLPVYQPAKMRDGEALAVLKELNPELIVVVAYGKILPKEILELPPRGCVNVHGSLLPKYRGAAPIQWSVLNGEREAGVTTMLMDEGLDTGDMLLRDSTPIGENETSGELYERLAPMGSRLLIRTIEELEKGSLTPVKQTGASSYAPMLDKNLSQVNWNKPAREVHNLIRGLTPWPTACTSLLGGRLKLYASSLGEGEGGEPGQIVSCFPFTVACGDGKTVVIGEVQPEGKKRMAAEAYFRGHPVPAGTVLG